MGKTVKYLMLPVLLLFCLPGATAHRQEPLLPVVDRVEVDCKQGAVHQLRRYTSDEKMSWVLNFMRLQENLGQPEENPELAAGDVYTVTVHLSDGRERIYRQRADRYLQIDGDTWQKIDPDWGNNFYYLLQTLPSDTPNVSRKPRSG